jgi:NSS family neurotransmitter:Na+ symporter
MAEDSTESLTWSSRTTFLLAAVGSSVGLGNFWRFPYEAGENGGGAFVIVYLACVLFVAMPLVVCELLIGRRGGLSAVGSARKVALAEGRSSLWSILGWVGMIASMVLLSFYSVIAGWFIVYLPKLAFLPLDVIAITGETIVTAGEAVVDRTARTAKMFSDLKSNWKGQLIGHSIFMVLTVSIVYRGLHSGIESAIRILMPTFFVMLFLLAIYAMIVGDAAAGLSFLFTPDFSKITPDVMIKALGHSFFSIGVGGAIMITYGAYLQKDVKIGQSAVIISLSDTLIAITAGMLIFPLVFKFGLATNEGPGLLFVTMPIAFAEMEWGRVIGPVFFLLALVAALTSAISMIEIFVRWAEEKGLSRHKAALTAGVTTWTLGLATVFSSTLLKDVKVLDKNPFDFFDFLTGSVLLPLGGLLVAIFVGWFVSRETLRDELAMTAGQFSLWRFVTRFIAPAAVAGILLLKLGVIGG